MNLRASCNNMGRYSTSSSAKTPNTTTPTLPFATDSSVLPPYRPTSIRQIFQPKRVSSHDSYTAEEVGNKDPYCNSMDALKLRRQLRHQSHLTKLKAKPPSNEGEDLIQIGLPSPPHNQPVTTTKNTTEADHDTHNSSLRWIKHVPINIYINIRSTENRFRSCVCSIMSLVESPSMHQTFQTSFRHQLSSTFSYIRDLLGELASYLEHLDERVGNEGIRLSSN